MAEVGERRRMVSADEQQPGDSQSLVQKVAAEVAGLILERHCTVALVQSLPSGAPSFGSIGDA